MRHPDRSPRCCPGEVTTASVVTSLPTCPTHGVCPPCREGWGHWNGSEYVPTLQSEATRTAAGTYGPTREDVLSVLTATLRRVEVRHVGGIAEADTAAAADELLAAIWPLIERRKGRGLDGGWGRP